MSRKVKKVWKPQLFQRELYSEILDRTFTVTVTARTLDLIDEAFGFDFYILKVSARQYQSLEHRLWESGLASPLNKPISPLDSQAGPVLQVWDGSEARDAAATRPPGPQAASR